MIPERPDGTRDVWAQLAAPLEQDAIQWRQDGKATQREGKWFARFVAFVDAQYVRERLDRVVPGEWDLTLDLLPPLPNDDGETEVSMKARLQILGVVREDVGTGRDYKTASSDAFKRVAVRFGVAHELYGYDQNWVQVDGDSRYAKPVEDPSEAYARRQTRSAKAPAAPLDESKQRAADDELARRRAAADKALGRTPEHEPAPNANANASAPNDTGPACPICGSAMYDNRATKKNPRQPDYKCKRYKDGCDGVIWPPKTAKRSTDTRETAHANDFDDFPPPLDDTPDGLPF